MVEVHTPCLLTAHGDATRVQLYRSPLVTPDCRMLAPVLNFIEAHGLTLAYTETEEDSGWMHGQRIREIYV